MGVLNRRDYETAIPQLEKKFSDLSKYITVSDGQVQIKIEDLYGKVATLTIDAEAIEARVDDAEDNIGDLQVTAQAITQSLTTKVTIFDSEPSPPYEFGDLWDKGNDGLYRCINSRSTGSYTASDWEEEDATAQDAQSAASAAQSTADGEVRTRTTMIRSISGGTLTCYVGGSKGVFVNANGSVDIVEVTWSNGVPTKGAAVASYGSTITIGKESDSTKANMQISGNTIDFRKGSTSYGQIEVNTFSSISGGGTMSTLVLSRGNGWLVMQNSSVMLGCSTSGASWGVTNPHIRITSSEVSVGRGGYPTTINGSNITMSLSGDMKIGGDVYFPDAYTSSTTNGDPLRCNTSNNGHMYVYTSSKRFKQNIKPMKMYSPDDLYKMEVVQFNPKDDPDFNEIGFISEQVNDVAPTLVSKDKEGKCRMWDEFQMLALAVKTIQEQNERIKELERKLA